MLFPLRWDAGRGEGEECGRKGGKDFIGLVMAGERYLEPALKQKRVKKGSVLKHRRDRIGPLSAIPQSRTHFKLEPEPSV